MFQYRDVEREPEGTYFEWLLLDNMQKRSRLDIQITTGTDLDKKEGTDAVIDGVPVDLTANYAKKIRMDVHPPRYELAAREITVPVRFGVRFGNQHHTFQTPVLVVGMDLAAPFLRKYEEEIAEKFGKEAEKLMDMGFDAYWTYSEQHGGCCG